jgi:uncharacterized protein YycO
MKRKNQLRGVLLVIIVCGLMVVFSIQFTFAQNKSVKVFHLDKEIEYLPKEDIAKDPRPLPKSPEEWSKIMKMRDPLGKLSTKDNKKGKKRFFTLGNTKDNTDYIPWTKMDWGDILIGRGSGKLNSIPYGYFRHAGIWHAQQKQVLTALMKRGVCWQTTTEWHLNYPIIRVLTVPSLTKKVKKQITLFTETQVGKPYGLSLKNKLSNWYCSKIPWAAYNKKGIDIDAKKAFYVTPDNIYRSKNTSLIFER